MPQVKETEPKRLIRVGDNLTVFQAPSTSRPGTFHFVIVYPDERGIHCTCEGWRFNGRCWHIEAVPLCLAKPKPWSDPDSDPLGDIERTKNMVLGKTLNVSKTFNLATIDECYYVEGHQGGHSWET